MILINMMMAIINLAFEEIKQNQSQYQNKFELLDYIKRTNKEVIGKLRLDVSFELNVACLCVSNCKGNSHHKIAVPRKQFALALLGEAVAPDKFKVILFFQSGTLSIVL